MRKRGAKMRLSPRAAERADELGSLLHMPPGQAVLEAVEVTLALVKSGKLKIQKQPGMRLPDVQAASLPSNAGTA